MFCILGSITFLFVVCISDVISCQTGKKKAQLFELLIIFVHKCNKAEGSAVFFVYWLCGQFLERCVIMVREETNEGFAGVLKLQIP
jgi:hypothetical protein